LDAPLVEARGLRRTYSVRSPGLRGLVSRGTERVALDGLDLDIHAGERVALLGANGAGKSTTVKLLCGLLAPSSGTLRVAGRTPHRDRAAHVRGIGAVFGQRTQLWWDLRVSDGLDVLARLHGVADGGARRATLCDALGVGPLLGQRVRELSLGQRTRCELVAALQHTPALLLLDEPSIGLDAGARVALRAAVRDACAQTGATVVLTSHDLGDVRAVCERVILLRDGRVVHDGSMDDLVARLGGQRRLVVRLVEPIVDAAALLGALGPGASVDGATVSLSFAGPAPARVAAVSAAVEAHGGQVHDLVLAEPDIDAVVARVFGTGP
jgi:ABC-2 type transport system ATP-binding protein